MSKEEKKGYRLGFQYRSNKELSYMEALEQKVCDSALSILERMISFPMYVPRQTLATFLYKYELFKKVLNVHGSIVECGVAYGAGLMTFAQFSAILEPVNYTRKIIGFDTFMGFPGISAQDAGSRDKHCKKGGMAVDTYAELQQCIELYDENRQVSHIPKVELVKGDAKKTIPSYIEKNPHLVVSLLYLDFDVYDPTLIALKNFVPRMPKGAIIAFDELCHPEWPGETVAVMEEIGINNLRIQRVPFDTTRSYAVLA
jgi:hypothetical protein